MKRIIGVVILLTLASCTDYHMQEEDVQVPESLGVSVSEINFTSASSTLSVTVSSGEKWDVSSMPSWIRLNAINRSGSSYYIWDVSFTAAANADYDRSGTIRFKTAKETVDLPVLQGGKMGKYVAVESVSLSLTEMTMTEGDTQELSATVMPSEASDKSVTWSSDNDSVASVSSSGVVSAKAEGSANITVKTNDGGKVATCRVSVMKKVIAVTGITLNKTSLTLKEGESETLTATVSPSDATDKTVTWTSSNTAVATVSNGKVTAKAVGTATITAKAGDKTATCTVTVISSGPEAVDLGLSVKWASYNVGATKPEEYGNYYAWGETTTKSNYEWSTYKWFNGSETTVTKYNTSSSYGTVDNRTQLEMQDDAARANWGGKWRMPTRAEFAELIHNCTWTWTTQDGKNGYKVTSKNNENSIFLPAAGARDGTSVENLGSSGYYWSSSLDNTDSRDSRCFYFKSSVGGTSRIGRLFGLSVRPVYGDLIAVSSVTLSQTSLSLSVGETAALSATVNPSNATDNSVTWTSSNTSVATVENGTVTATSAGTAVITAIAGNKYATCTVTVTQPSSGPEAVDLGLPSGIKWASYNVGASKPEEYGDYFAWGETSPKSDYSEETYSSTVFAKYIQCYYLEMSDDVARAMWGGKWRMPTTAEFEELKSNCTYAWTTRNGVNGYQVTSKKNGNFIFLPAAGRRESTSVSYAGSGGFYWSSSRNYTLRWYACYLDFSSSVFFVSDAQYRFNGLSVRPVTE